MSAPNGSTGLTYYTPDGGKTWTVVQSLGGGGGGAGPPPIWAPVGSAGGVLSAGGVAVVGGAGGPSVYTVPSPHDAIGGPCGPTPAAIMRALVDLFDGNNEVAKTCAYDHPGMTPERCAEIAEVVDACRRWGGAK